MLLEGKETEKITWHLSALREQVEQFTELLTKLAEESGKQ